MYPFGRWPIGDVPRAAAGVYTIWGDDELVYVGMSGRGLTAAQIAQPARDDLRIEIVTWIERTYHHRRRQSRFPGHRLPGGAARRGHIREPYVR